MVKIFLIALTVIALGCSPEKALISNSIDIIPRPIKVELYDAHFELLSNTTIRSSSSADLSRDLLIDYTLNITGVKLEINHYGLKVP